MTDILVECFIRNYLYIRFYNKGELSWKKKRIENRERGTLQCQMYTKIKENADNLLNKIREETTRLES